MLNDFFNGGAAAAAGYEIERSLRFNSADSAYLNRTFSAGNRRTWTWAGWVKRSAINPSNIYNEVHLFTCVYAPNNSDENYFRLMYNGDRLQASWYSSTVRAEGVFRDQNAWYHVVCAVDTTQATASNRVKLYVNGVEQSKSVDSPPSQDYEQAVNSAQEHYIGRGPFTVGQIYNHDGYLADVHFIDGQALDATSFGEFDDNGIWQPIAYTGGYGIASVADATGALPIYNTTDTFGTVKGTGTRTDSNSSSIVLAVPMDGANGGTTFTDESATIKGSGSAKTITRNNTTTSTAISKYYGSSGSFNGSTTNLEITSSLSDFEFSGNFTLECWLYLNSGAAADRYLLDYRSAGPSGQNTYIYFNSGNNGSFRFNIGGAGEAISATNAAPKGSWHHFALVRNGSTITAYINGTSVLTQTNSTTVSAPGTSLKIGSAWTNSTQPWDGYISDFRVYKGVAKYTSDFTPVTTSNSFHLPFSDTSTAAALGTDTSGASNNWSVNNITALGALGPETDVITGVTLPQFASTSVISSSNNTPNADPLFEYFDYATTYGGSWSPTTITEQIINVNPVGPIIFSGANGTLTFTPPSHITGSHTWVFALFSYSGTNTKYSINGGTFTGLSAFSRMASIGFTGTLTSFRIQSSGGFVAIMGAIFVDGDHLMRETALDLASSQNLAQLSVGETVIQDNSAARGTISSIDSGTNTLSVTGTIGTWSANTSNYAIETNTYSSTSDTDSLIDVPTNGTETDTGLGNEVRGNYATLNPLDNGGVTLSNGNLDVTLGATRGVRSSFGVSSGKYYYEMTVGTFGTNGPAVGIAYANANISTNYAGSDANAWTYNGGDGKIYNNASGTGSNATYTTNDVIGVAINMDSGVVTFYKNGSAQPTTVTSLSGTVFPVVTTGGTAGIQYFNFGQRPFAYTAPSGFKALCTSNLPTPTIADGSDYMDVVTYTGNGTSQTISGLGFSPDFVWIKERSGTDFHILQDTVRGAGFNINTNNTSQETGNSGDLITSFNSDGFTVNNTYLGTSNTSTNGLSQTQVAWTWDAGSSTVSNTDGSITSSVRANPSAGFSIVTWTGTASAGTIGHGLGIAPQFFIVKNRSVADSWYCYHESLGNAARIQLNETSAATTGSSQWNSASPTSTVFSVGAGSWQASGNNLVTYCFAPVEGYSSFGSYTGNGSSDGPFVYTGFRPRWVMVKGSTYASNWNLLDTARDPYNLQSNLLRPNLSTAESSTSTGTFAICWDGLSNGFKLRGGSGTNDVNQTSQTYIYAAFAENPFALNARAR